MKRKEEMEKMMENMDMSKMMSGMKEGQEMPSMEMMQKMCKMMEKEGFKPWDMCKSMQKSLDEMVKVNKEILEELKKK